MAVLGFQSRRTRLDKVVLQLGPQRDVAQVAARKPEQLILVKKLLDGEEEGPRKDLLVHDMLVTAAWEGNMPAIKELIKRGHVLRKFPGMIVKGHPLFAAIRADEPEIALELLSAGVNIHATESGLVTALHVASDKDQEDVVVKLLDSGASPNVRDDDMRSPLSWAAWAGRGEIVDLLIERGARLGLQQTESPSVLTEAIRGENFGLARRLIDKYQLSADAVAKSLQYLPISWNGCPRAMTFALNLGLDLETDHYLFDTGSSVDRIWRRRVIKLLSVEALFKNLTYQRQAEVYTGRITALHHMIMKGDHRGVNSLLKAGALVNMESSNHGTPIMMACRYGRFRMTRLLLRQGAVLSYTKDEETFSAVREAAAHPEIIHWILVDRFTDQRKLEAPSIGLEHVVAPVCESEGSSASATTMGCVPWNIEQFIASEDLDDYIRATLASFRCGTFYCREDGCVILVETGSTTKPWD